MRKTSVLLMIASDLYFSKLPQTSNYQSLIESLLLMIYNLTLVTGTIGDNNPLSMIYNLMLVTGSDVERRVLIVFGIKILQSLLINIKLFCNLK